MHSYPLVTQSLTLAGRRWEVSCVTDQDALMESVHSEAELVNFPFGLLLWASAEALASRLAQEPTLVAGKRVLELGAGVGLVGMVAAHLGGMVTQTDYHPDVLAVCRSNQALNGVENLTIRKADWREWPSDLTGFDLVIAADVLYERKLHLALRSLFLTLKSPILLADPIRPPALEFVEKREAEGWKITTEAKRLRWAGEWRDTMLLWIYPPPEVGVADGNQLR